MARTSSEAVRHQLEKLWDAVQQSEDERFTEDALVSLGIRRCDLDLEIQPEDQTSSDAPILLSLLPEDQLDDHPIDYAQYEKENSLKGLLIFEDYLPSLERDSYNHGRRAARTKAFVHYWASQAERVGFPYREGPGHEVFFCLANKVGWDNISLPHPWYLFAQFSHFARSRARHTQCTVGPTLEWQDKVQNDVSKFAHLTIFAENWGTGNDNSIQMGELKAIISGMKSRSKQLDIPEEQQEDAQSTRDEILNKWYSLAFPDENRFPVVLVSFLGPQHGRIFYASMDKKKLVIRQSKLYSFQRKATAPFNLFTRWILYTPLAEDS